MPCFHSFDYAFADEDGFCDYLRNVPWEDILNSVLLLLLVNCEGGFRLELMYISLIVSIRSNLTHFYGFQLPVLLFIEITFFVCTNRINLLSLK